MSRSSKVHHGQHERSSMEAGMARQAALEMANRLDTWNGEVLRLRPSDGAETITLH